jgi:hypothetical protein
MIGIIMPKNRLGASLHTDRTISPVSVEIHYSTKRAHKMKGASQASKRKQSVQKRIHLVEQFLQLNFKQQMGELRRYYPHAKIETRQSGKKKWSGELWVGNELRLQRKGKTSGKAFRAIMTHIASEIAEKKLQD